jgi:hypothetical protein
MQTGFSGAKSSVARIWFPLALAAAGVLAFSIWGQLSSSDTPRTEDGEIAAASTETATEPVAIPNTETFPDASPSPGTAGLQVFLDPETGELGPATAEQRRTLIPQMERDLSYSDEGLQVITRADGSRHVHLEGRFQSYSVARMREDGSLETQCVQGEEAAHRLLQESPPSTGPAPPEE